MEVPLAVPMIYSLRAFRHLLFPVC